MRFLSFFLSSFSKMIAITVDSQTCSLLIASKEKKRKKKKGGDPACHVDVKLVWFVPFFFFFSRPFDLVELVPFSFPFPTVGSDLPRACRRWRFTCWRQSFHFFFFSSFFFFFFPPSFCHAGKQWYDKETKSFQGILFMLLWSQSRWICSRRFKNERGADWRKITAKTKKKKPAAFKPLYQLSRDLNLLERAFVLIPKNPFCDGYLTRRWKKMCVAKERKRKKKRKKEKTERRWCQFDYDEDQPNYLKITLTLDYSKLQSDLLCTSKSVHPAIAHPSFLSSITFSLWLPPSRSKLQVHCFALFDVLSSFLFFSFFLFFLSFILFWSWNLGGALLK